MTALLCLLCLLTGILIGRYTAHLPKKPAPPKPANQRAETIAAYQRMKNG